MTDSASTIAAFLRSTFTINGRMRDFLSDLVILSTIQKRLDVNRSFPVGKGGQFHGHQRVCQTWDLKLKGMEPQRQTQNIGTQNIGPGFFQISAAPQRKIIHRKVGARAKAKAHSTPPHSGFMEQLGYKITTYDTWSC